MRFKQDDVQTVTITESVQNTESLTRGVVPAGSRRQSDEVTIGFPRPILTSPTGNQRSSWAPLQRVHRRSVHTTSSCWTPMPDVAFVRKHPKGI
eukprot:1179757-Prorocentrum_minimum.AAC.1